MMLTEDDFTPVMEARRQAEALIREAVNRLRDLGLPREVVIRLAGLDGFAAGLYDGLEDAARGFAALRGDEP